MEFQLMFVVAVAVLTGFCLLVQGLSRLPASNEKLTAWQEEITAGICMALLAFLAAPFLCCLCLLSIEDPNLVGIYFLLLGFLTVTLVGLFWLALYFSYASLNDDEDFISEDDILL